MKTLSLLTPRLKGNTSGKVLFIDENTSKRIVRDIQKKQRTLNPSIKKSIFEVPFFVIGKKEFKFGLAENTSKSIRMRTLDITYGIPAEVWLRDYEHALSAPCSFFWRVQNFL